jgi:hypothetical protein
MGVLDGWDEMDAWKRHSRAEEGRGTLQSCTLSTIDYLQRGVAWHVYHGRWILEYVIPMRVLCVHRFNFCGCIALHRFLCRFSITPSSP